MDSNRAARQKRAELRFLLAAGGTVVLLCVAAFWFAVPFETTSIEPAASSVELAQMVRVDINHDDAAALATLPGVGEKKAQAIIDYRTRHGAFKTVQEVTRVSGITKKLVESWGNMAYAG